MYVEPKYDLTGLDTGLDGQDVVRQEAVRPDGVDGDRVVALTAP